MSGTAQTRDLEAVLGALVMPSTGRSTPRPIQQARASLLLDEEMSSSSPLGTGRAFAAQAIYMPSATSASCAAGAIGPWRASRRPLVSVVARDAFRPTETAVMLVGDITPERAAPSEPRFGAAYTERPRERRSTPSPNPSTIALGVESMRSSQLQLVYGLPTPDIDAPDWAAYQVLEAVLAGGFTSSLNTRIRHELGASYGVRWGGWHSFPGRAGFIEARIDADQAVPALHAFFTELMRVRSAPLSEAELTRARRVVWGEWETSFVTPSGLFGRVRARLLGPHHRGPAGRNA
ncbi:MAG: insulinase family protein [Sandaracinaceae bacterium]|nr:insulinase family protein [Sandaracinaceae bacterium]